MFPIRDHNPSGRTPFVTYGLIAANVVIFLSYWQGFGLQLVAPSVAAANDAQNFAMHGAAIKGLQPRCVNRRVHA